MVVFKTMGRIWYCRSEYLYGKDMYKACYEMFTGCEANEAVKAG